jgi:hypothetical protein
MGRLYFLPYRIMGNPVRHGKLSAVMLRVIVLAGPFALATPAHTSV